MADLFADYARALAALRGGQLEKAAAQAAALMRRAPRWEKPRLLAAYAARASGQYEEEIALLAPLRASASSPALCAEAYSLSAAARSLLGEGVQAVEDYLMAARLEPDRGQQRAELSNAEFAACYVDFPPETFQAIHRRYQASLADIHPLPQPRYAHARLRVGYLSANFRAHPLAFFFWPLLLHHDRTRVEVYCYAAGTREDAYTRAMRAHADVWRTAADMTDETLARQIRADEIDVLVELDGHTGGNRLPVLAYRPAPVLLAGIGYMGSTGLPFLDGFLTDRACVPDRAVGQAYFAEPLRLLPTCHLCYAPIKELPDPGPLPCLVAGQVTFGCLNNFSKVTDELLEDWADILRRVPGSRLLLKHRVFDSAEGRRRVCGRLRRAGICSERVRMEGLSEDYLTTYQRIDIALDTYPYTGALTTCEALAMGVPVVTRAGARPGSAFGRSILQAAGLGELVTQTRAAYRERAAALARDRELLSALRANLRAMLLTSPLLDGRRYARELEALYEALVRGKV